MDFSSHHMDFHRPSSTLSSAVDRKPSTYSTYDDPALDPTVLDTPSIMSPTTSTQGIFSPDASWMDEFTAGSFVDRTATSSVNPNNPFFEQPNNNPFFARMSANEAAGYGQQTSWPVADNSGSRTPTAPKPLNPFVQANLESAPSAFGPVASQMQSGFGNHGLPIHTPNVRPSSIFPSAQPEQPLSPHNNSEWLAFNQQQQMEARPGPKRVRPNTPPRSFSPRRDGIRKKNARFDIPPDRNLLNIDQLIASTTDEDQLKELKQQKRLLRNRQAALDSRQRKKKHTEELEAEKKEWSEQVALLQEEMSNMRLQMESLMNEKENWNRERMEAQQLIGQLQWDKEELVRTHTLETGELRKKVSVLTERLEATSSGMSTEPSSTFSEFASEMDSFNMGSSDWEGLFVHDDNEFIIDEQTPGPREQEQSLVVAPRSKDAEDKPVASGLLLMLLLCGAFVASKSSGSTAPPIPRMPDEVRAASATVLDSIFKDAGVAQQGVLANRVEAALEPTASGLSWPKATVSGSELGFSGSTLDQLHSQLTGPTKDQEAEQLFSITPSQYNSLTTVDFTRPRYSMTSDDLTDPLSPGSQPSHRRNLAETLAAMREQAKGESAADVYTRSLLWDKIPADVVREFKRMVEESASRPSTSDGDMVKFENVA